jgi:pyruvate formate lyase activating enzyme
MRRGLVFNIQKYSVQDGPGIRTTVFLKGCPLRCAWCHNPEGISPEPEFILVDGKCIGCGECRKACHHAPAGPDLTPLPREVQGCEFCGACVEACPTDGRRLVGTFMSVEEVVAAVLRDRVFYEQSGGGVTFSGGEPLWQAEFLKEALKCCKTAGLHTAVDTCGLAPLQDLLGIAPFTDLFLYDVKSMNDKEHIRYTGLSNERILHNLRELGRVHKSIWIRIPLIPGFNDGKTQLEATARFAAAIRGVRQVNLLPYHKLGSHKFKRVGRNNRLAGLEPPSLESLSSGAVIFRNAGLLTRTGG